MSKTGARACRAQHCKQPNAESEEGLSKPPPRAKISVLHAKSSDARFQLPAQTSLEYIPSTPLLPCSLDIEYVGVAEWSMAADLSLPCISLLEEIPRGFKPRRPHMSSLFWLAWHNFCMFPSKCPCVLGSAEHGGLNRQSWSYSVSTALGITAYYDRCNQ